MADNNEQNNNYIPNILGGVIGGLYESNNPKSFLIPYSNWAGGGLAHSGYMNYNNPYYKSGIDIANTIAGGLNKIGKNSDGRYNIGRLGNMVSNLFNNLKYKNVDSDWNTYNNILFNELDTDTVGDFNLPSDTGNYFA